ncbi:ribonuclease P protein component [Bacillus sp. V3B]|uniref:ribonuclease P protein component n=1 Tax=Bacillus sp. V3B TaxID=2804915 RepID=UPI0021098AD5|nr:ribonuclease P protein component [Bacillus sp. V3B]MCQ6276647.1 ribonuclease P protein component [Bacillus sp. V3B]
MRKEYRIKKNKEFQEAFKKGKSVANRQFVVYTLKKPDQKHFRIGLSVSKKVGNAVTRNQIKRYVRQVFHELDGQLHNDVDYVIIARKPTATMDFFEIQQSLSHVLRLAHVLKKFKYGQGKQLPAKTQGEKSP